MSDPASSWLECYPLPEHSNAFESSRFVLVSILGCCVLAVSWSWRRGHAELPLCTARAALSCTSSPHAGGTRQALPSEDISKFLVRALALSYALQLS